MRTVEEIEQDIAVANAHNEDALWLEWFRAVANGIEPSRLREMCKAEQDGLCVVLPTGEIDNRTTLWFVTKDSYIYKARAYELGNIIWYYKPKQFYLTRAEAETAKETKEGK